MRPRVRRDRGDVALRGIDDVVGGAAALGHAGVGQVGEGQDRGAPALLGFLEPGFALLDLGGHAFHLLHLGQKFRRTFGQLRHGGVGGLGRAAKLLDLGELGAPGGVDGQHGLEIAVEMFLRDGRPHGVGVFAQKLGIDHSGTGLTTNSCK